ncbi:MAG: hypothetical protein IIC26_04685, partial [Chloroflexi bacterium]|nr:hypothetical protein [Chloroflexota bacterium]
MTEHNPARPKWALAAIALLAALAAAVVWAGPGPASAGGDTCDPARTHEVGDFPVTLDSGGLTREYALHIPPSYTGAEAVPLVLNFHGLGGNAEQQASYSGLLAKADAEGFIVVMPQGLSNESLPLNHWNILLASPDTGEADDVAFTSDMLDELEAELCIDAARIYATGMSNGAQMSVRAGCSLSDRIAAIAPVAGVYFPLLAVEVPAPAGCVVTRPVSVIAFHGTADPIIPFDGGPLGLEDIGVNVTFRDIDDEIMPEWAAHNGCDSVAVEEQVTENVRLVRYQACDEGATVELYVVEGGGHTWPDATLDFPEDVLGVTTHEISANDLMWEFFVAHPVPADTEL